MNADLLTLHYLDMMVTANDRQLRLDMESAEEHAKNNKLIYDEVFKLEQKHGVLEALDE